MANKFLLSHIFIALTFVYGVQSAVFTIKNNCPYTIWPAVLTGAGNPVQTGFELAPRASKSVTVTSPWSGRVWARTHCSTSNGKLVCETADCTTGELNCQNKGGVPPASLAEFTLGGYGQQDFYDISLVDGFNLPVSIKPVKAGCRTTACPNDVNRGCPSQLAVQGKSGGVIGCKSACAAFNTPEFCCSGDRSTPDKCGPTAFSKFMKARCPQAYSYAYDDKTSTFTCPTGGDYVITFCP